ncbi:MAG: mechanosensitive ion channel [Legionellaceae bacterium]|nr:mechanosensitive ion channel [Legionellaceae bacterium]
MLIASKKSLFVLATDSSFYTQVKLLGVGFIMSLVLSLIIKKALFLSIDRFKNKLKASTVKFLNELRPYLFFVIFILSLIIGEAFLNIASETSWLVHLAQVITVLIIINLYFTKQLSNRLQLKFARLFILPLAWLFFMGWLDDIAFVLEKYSFTIGNIKITLKGVFKVLIFGTLLYWLSKVSNSKGKTIIRRQQNLDAKTKEIFIKLFEVGIYIIFTISMLVVIGIDLTTLAIFGGALGVGLGFGLQSIASNFISGIIILLDRSISVGDHIELEDGQKGILRQLNMRSATIETFEGKDIIVPNEKFISNTFINWTHVHDKQRYSINLQVSYQTDLHNLFDIIRKTIAAHPQVLSGDSIPLEEQPDAEISSFGESGVNILIEYWMEGIDDGKNRVGADLLLMLWDIFHENNIEIPYPQRQVTILAPSS